MSSLKLDSNKYTPRKEQQDAFDFIKNDYNKNKNKFYMMNMPVGVGKSHLAIMLSEWFNRTNNNATVDVITAGKILQDQYDTTYDSIANFKGKSNYQCSQYNCSCENGKEFNKLNKTFCESCPYDSAKDSFVSNKVSLTNFHLYLTYAMFEGGIKEQRKSRLLIVDECHDLDDVMSDFISMKITERIVKKYKFPDEKSILKELKNITVIDDYCIFLNNLSEKITSLIQSLDTSLRGKKRNPSMDKRNSAIGDILGGGSEDIKKMQRITKLGQLSRKIELFLREYKSDPDNWVLESKYNEKTKVRELSLEPIWAYNYLNQYVWERYDMVVLMSGTILDKDLFCELNGIDKDFSTYYSVESPFPLENRKIYYMPLGKMSYSKKENTFKNYVPYIYKILKKYKDVKGLIHTNSFELASWIEKSIKDERLIFHDSSDRDDRLNEHFENKYPTVFVSPSVSTGVSFDHEKSRWQIIAKIPYPSLGSKKIKLRKENNPKWYAWKTVCSIIQMTGRSVRSKTDYADTIILDGSFSDVMLYSSKFFPDWFSKAIISVNAKKKSS